MLLPTLRKVKSVQEACVKCFSVHILKFEMLQIHENENALDLLVKN